MQNPSIYERLHEAVVDFPRGLAVYYQGTKIRFKKFGKLVNRTADILANRLNVKKGDVLLIVAAERACSERKSGVLRSSASPV